jgi:hypothetical protein
MKDGKMVYFGPYDSAALNKHMPVDGMLHDATVEGKESATAAHKHEDKVSPGQVWEGRGQSGLLWYGLTGLTGWHATS